MTAVTLVGRKALITHAYTLYGRRVIRLVVDDRNLDKVIAIGDEWDDRAEAEVAFIALAEGLDKGNYVCQEPVFQNLEPWQRAALLEICDAPVVTSLPTQVRELLMAA